MRGFLFIKVLFLLTALGIVVAMIKGMKPTAVEEFFAALGMNGSVPETGRIHKSDANGSRTAKLLEPQAQNFRLCRTRVQAIEWLPGHQKLEEVADGRRRWLATPSQSEVPYLDVEKWFSSHCDSRIFQLSGMPPKLNFQPFVVIYFVDGSNLNLERAESNTFRIGSEIMVSQDLSKAFAELQRLSGVP